MLVSLLSLKCVRSVLKIVDTQSFTSGVKTPMLYCSLTLSRITDVFVLRMLLVALCPLRNLVISHVLVSVYFFTYSFVNFTSRFQEAFPCVRLEVLKVVTMTNTVFWSVASCGSS
jgi:hypothetical protein